MPGTGPFALPARVRASPRSRLRSRAVGWHCYDRWHYEMGRLGVNHDDPGHPRDRSVLGKASIAIKAVVALDAHTRRPHRLPACPDSRSPPCVTPPLVKGLRAVQMAGRQGAALRLPHQHVPALGLRRERLDWEHPSRTRLGEPYGPGSCESGVCAGSASTGPDRNLDRRPMAGNDGSAGREYPVVRPHSHQGARASCPSPGIRHQVVG